MKLSLPHCWNGSPSKFRLMLFSNSEPHCGYAISDLVGRPDIRYPTAFNPATGSALARFGKSANSKAGIGISHRVKFDFTSVPCSEY